MPSDASPETDLPEPLLLDAGRILFAKARKLDGDEPESSRARRARWFAIAVGVLTLCLRLSHSTWTTTFSVVGTFGAIFAAGLVWKERGRLRVTRVSIESQTLFRSRVVRLVDVWKVVVIKTIDDQNTTNVGDRAAILLGLNDQCLLRISESEWGKSKFESGGLDRCACRVPRIRNDP